jgi:GGDEF domain-containing protein
MAVRGEDRPKGKEEGEKRRERAASFGRGAGDEDSLQPDNLLSVTISIGGAEPAQGMTPAQVLKAADEALYRAKRGGRNRVSR